MKATFRPEVPAVAAVARAAGREAWLDNLRVVLIAGVIGSHVGVIYALDVGWWYEERTASDLATAVLAGMFAPGLLFAMGLLFFVAGLFTPPALARKGTRRFVTDRLWRLGVPTVAYLVVVNPALNFFGDRAMGRGEAVADYFRQSYGDDVELGVAWFLAALLLFSLAYAGWRARHPVRPENGSRLHRNVLVRTGVLIAVGSFLVRLVFPVLSGDQLWAANLWEYPQMVAMFALGILTRERGWLSEGLSPQLRRTCGAAAGIGLLLATGVGVGIATAGDPGPFLGGFHLRATLIPLVEATLALGMSLWLIDWFRRHAHRASRLVGELGRASFAAYLVHVPVTIALAIALREVRVAAELKFLFVFVVGAAASFGIGWVAGRSRVAGRIL